MKPVRRLSLAEQTAAHLREGMRGGRWGGNLPGVNQLSEDLHVSRETIRAALRLLERSGEVVANGPGRSRVIAPPSARRTGRRNLRIGVLLNEPIVEENAEMQRLLLRLQHGIELAGHVCVFSDECQSHLRYNVRRIVSLVKRTRADAWIVVGGPMEVLRWFSTQGFPTLALGGRSGGLPIASAGADPSPAVITAVRRLGELGHRRIVMVCPSYWRTPTLGRVAMAFQDTLKEIGIAMSEYHLPDWVETPDGLQDLLRSLFRLTPPTALLMLEPAHVIAALAHLGRRGLQSGRDVSVIAMVTDPTFAWRRPALAHFKWNNERFVRHLVDWVQSVAAGKPNTRQMLFPMTFVPGGTIGPPTGGKMRIA